MAGRPSGPPEERVKVLRQLAERARATALSFGERALAFAGQSVLAAELADALGLDVEAVRARIEAQLAQG